jgi:hypothetical protein
MVFLDLGCVCKKVNMFLHWKGICYGINWIGIHGFTFLLSCDVVVALSAKRMTKIDEG